MRRCVCPALAAVLLAWAGQARAALYYINDASTNGDVYCSAVGSDANDGLTTHTPKYSLTNLFANYNLVGNDIVYIDTGVYSNYTFTVTCSGTVDNLLTFQGSTNYAAGGTVLSNSASYGIYLFNSPYVSLRDLTITRSANHGVFFRGATGCRLYRVNAFNFNGAYNGFCIGGAHITPSHNVTMSNCIVGSGNNKYAIYAWGQTGLRIINSVCWGSKAFYLQYSATVSNCIIGASGAGNYVFDYYIPTGSDYNIYFLTNAAWMSASYQRLEDYQAAYSNCDIHSTFADPGLVDSENYDFHLQSAVGRWTTNGWVTDAATSPGIDFGSPDFAYASEPPPNGSRINCGAYGNTPEASLSNTNPWLRCITFNRSAVVTGTQTLHWIAANFAVTSTVALQYSADGGDAWSNLATGVLATNEFWVWDTTLSTPSVRGMWKVVSESNTNIFDTNDYFITVKNAPVAVYVNDSSTNGDIYCTAVGSDTNSGTSPADPLYSIQKAIDTYSLGAGDTVYVDTGYYTNTVALQGQVVGAVDNPFVIQGSTNYAGVTNGSAGGPTIIECNGATLFSLSRKPDVNAYLRLADMTLKGGTVGLYMQGHHYCEFYRLILRDNTSFGIQMGGGGQFPSNYSRFDNCILANNTSYGLYNYNSVGVIMNNATVYGTYGVYGSTSVSNSIFRVSGSGRYAYGSLPSGSDYNSFVTTNSAGIMAGYMTLAAFQAAYTNHDQHSQEADPLFADPDNYDFHELSKMGRWTTNGWVQDSVNSPVIDTGEPGPVATYTNEPPPNGNRLNAGAYGNTDEASKSSTNPTLHVLTYNNGGVLTGTGTVYWTAQNFAAAATATIQYSADGGETWTNVVTALPATNQAYAWNSTPFTSSLRGRWRIVSTDDPAVNSTNGTYFTLKNEPLAAYVNDMDTNGDVYCTAIGSATNTGVTPDSPRLTVQSLQDDYSLSGGDTIYVDTGYYTNPIVFDGTDIGSAGNPLTIQGSTNYAGVTNGSAGGPTIIECSGSSVFSLVQRPGLNAYLRLADMTLKGGTVGLYMQGHHYCEFYRLILRDNISYGIQMGGGGQLPSNYSRFDNCILANNTSYGLYNYDSVGVIMNNATVYGTYGVYGSTSVSNSIFRVSGSGRYAYYGSLPSGSDYNSFVTTNSAGIMAGYLTLAAFQAAYTNHDQHSQEADPLFADPDNYDFHELSKMGRWTTNGWVQDAVYSPVIDAGDTNCVYALEPKPNGRRINCGAYGNTPEASQSRFVGSLLRVW